MHSTLRTTTLLFVVLAARLALQAQSAAVEGSVVDESQALIPGVTITVTNLDTGQTRTAVTDGRGQFRVLEIGRAHV